MTIDTLDEPIETPVLEQKLSSKEKYTPEPYVFDVKKFAYYDPVD